MVSFASGDATSTIKATTLESAAVVASHLLQNLEEATPSLETAAIAVNYFTGDKTVQVQFSTPITTEISASGKLIISGVDYVSYPGFTPGGDLKSTQLPSAVLELFQMLQAAEKSAENPEDPEALNRVNISYDMDALIGTVNAELPIAFTVNTTGKIEISAVSYLPNPVVEE